MAENMLHMVQGTLLARMWHAPCTKAFISHCPISKGRSLSHTASKEVQEFVKVEMQHAFSICSLTHLTQGVMTHMSTCKGDGQ